MKKVIVFLATLCVGLVSVSAMSESDLRAKLTQSYSVNGSTFVANSEQANLIDEYLRNYDITSTDADYIVTKLNEAMNVLKNSGKSSFYDMTKAQKDQIIGLVADVSANTGVKATIYKNNLYICNYNSTSCVPGTSNVFYSTPIYPSNTGSIRATGNGLTVAAAGLISVAGIAVALKKAKENA